MPTIRKVWQERAKACPENQRMVLFNQRSLRSTQFLHSAEHTWIFRTISYQRALRKLYSVEAYQWVTAFFVKHQEVNKLLYTHRSDEHISECRPGILHPALNSTW